MLTPTIRELNIFNGWGNKKIIEALHGLSDEQLDRPFEMGPGSLRATVQHIYNAERIWVERYAKEGVAGSIPAEPSQTPAELDAALSKLASVRDAWLSAQPAGSADRLVTYKNLRGEQYTNRLGDILMHVCNHGVHHRAQAVNMIRRVGGEVPKPGADYIFMKLTTETVPPETSLDVRTLLDYLSYSDWARRRVHELAEGLSDEQLDRAFEMGMNTLRRTLIHMYDAEAWWRHNWTNDGGVGFPDDNRRMSIKELSRQYDELAAWRDTMTAKMSDKDLDRVIKATPRPGVDRFFRLGVTMLQICVHGTHHRAQASNMLRHLGVKSPVLDYVVKLR